jgi:hypothetical protein
MSYDNTTAILTAGMMCLRDRLGVVESEIFIASIKAEDYNYTEWRSEQPWVNMPLDEAMDSAIKYVQNNPDVIPVNAEII